MLILKLNELPEIVDTWQMTVLNVMGVEMLIDIACVLCA